MCLCLYCVFCRPLLLLCQIPESVLPPPKSTQRTQSSRGGASGGASAVGASSKIVRCDADFHSKHGRVVYLFSSRSDLVKLRMDVLEQRLGGVSSSPPSASSSSSSGGEAAAAAVSAPSPSATPPRVYRMNFSYTAAALVPPELHHSRHHAFVMVTTSKNGLVRHDDEDLVQIDKGEDTYIAQRIERSG